MMLGAVAVPEAGGLTLCATYNAGLQFVANKG